MENKLFELAAKRRSVRRYAGGRISDETIREIMKVALAAPCSFGHRPVEFIVVRNKDRIKELAACKSLGGSQIIGADAVAVVMVKLERGEFWIEDGAIASSYILLAAEQYDLGACWYTFVIGQESTDPLMKKSVSCLMCRMDMLYSTLLLLAVKAKRNAGTRKLIWIKVKCILKSSEVNSER